MQPRNILVVGAPRSGTSMTAAALARCGYFVGQIAKEHVRRGDDGNPFGYFEADDLVEHNVAIFQAAGYAAHNTWKFEPIGPEAVSRIGTLPPTAEHRTLLEGYRRHAPWVWKDPRLCFTLPYWWRLLDPHTTGVLLVRRDFDAIVRSWIERRWCPADEAARRAAQARILQHYLAAEAALRSGRIPHEIVDYAACLDAPAATAARLSAFCGCTITPDALNSRPELNHATRPPRLLDRIRGRCGAALRTWLGAGMPGAAAPTAGRVRN